MKKKGFSVKNTNGEDLDVDYHKYLNSKVTTAFEIFEHMFAPFNMLLELKGTLICSIPLNIPFQQEHWNDKDKMDCHYHEFTKRQFDHLLHRTGWEIIDYSYIYDSNWMGIRPLLRKLYPSFYIVYAVKN